MVTGNMYRWLVVGVTLLGVVLGGFYVYTQLVVTLTGYVTRLGQY
jgi:hypothetical protein